MGEKGRSGAANGRLGGRLSGAAKASDRLRHLPRLTSLISKKKKKSGGDKRPRRVKAGGLPAADAAGIKALGAAYGHALDLNPRERRLVELGAAAFALGFRAACDAPSNPAEHAAVSMEIETPLTTRVPDSERQRPKRPAQAVAIAANKKQRRATATTATATPQAAAESSGAAMTKSIRRGKRGDVFEVSFKASYGAGKDYTWDDVVNVCRLLTDKKLNLVDLDTVDETGRLLHKVPRTTAERWLQDDAEFMAERGEDGVEGRAHWLVELEDRGRTNVPTPGVKQVLGEEVEDKLMLDISEAAIKGWQYVHTRGGVTRGGVTIEGHGGGLWRGANEGRAVRAGYRGTSCRGSCQCPPLIVPAALSISLLLTPQIP
jgi:hypothetical protein